MKNKESWKGAKKIPLKKSIQLYTPIEHRTISLSSQL